VSSQNSTGEQFEMRGIMQRSFEYIFQTIERERAEQEQKGCEVQYLVKASYLEIYNE
jgi:Kinesin motor domain